MKHVIIAYHAASLDGFTGAWAFWHYWRNTHTLTTIAVTQKTLAPEVKDAEVYMVGFVYARGCVRRLLANGCTVYMVGNHRSAEVDLNGLPVTYLGGVDESAGEMAFDYVAPDEVESPLLLQYIADAHLYLHAMPNSREVRASLDSEPKTFENWDRLMSLTETDPVLQSMIARGEIVCQVRSRMARNIINATKRRIRINNANILVANCPASLASDVANQLAEMEPYAMVYYDTRTGRHFELRSHRTKGIDVMPIARMYGGGGHTHAAGFIVPRAHWLARI